MQQPPQKLGHISNQHLLVELELHYDQGQEQTKWVWRAGNPKPVGISLAFKIEPKSGAISFVFKSFLPTFFFQGKEMGTFRLYLDTSVGAFLQELWQILAGGHVISSPLGIREAQKGSCFPQMPAGCSAPALCWDPLSAPSASVGVSPH